MGFGESEDLVSLLPAEYEHVRSNAAWFLIALDHEILLGGSEWIAETHERYQVAEKSGAAGALAEAMDPRAALTSRSIAMSSLSCFLTVSNGLRVRSNKS